MKFLDRIGLAKSIEIPTSSSAGEFEQQLMNFKHSGKGKVGLLSSAGFIPAELTIENGEFIFSKIPRILRPFAPIGEIRGSLKLNENNTIEARIFSIFYLLIFNLFISIMLVTVLIFFSNGPVIAKLSFILVIIGFNALSYFLLRNSVKQLELEFRSFMKGEVLNSNT